jgi:cystathionine beta-lyase/cystathionine gamma-synthase
VTDHPPGPLALDTRLVHVHTPAAQVPSRPIATPLVLSSSFAFDDLDDLDAVTSGRQPGYAYTRASNPTTATLEAAIADAEGTDGAVAFASGMAAIHAAIGAVVRPGDHVVAPRALYGGTYAILTHHFRALGVETTFVDNRALDAWAAAMRPNTRLVWAESITNPTLDVLDLPAIARLAHDHGAKLAVDATFVTPVLQRPAAHGADLVVHSATKYLGGHGDLIAGLVAASGELLGDVRRLAIVAGGNAEPFTAWLVLRGLKTLGLRMTRHTRSALAVAAALDGHPRVERVYYPGLPSHPDHGTRLLDVGAGGVVSLEPRGGPEAARRFVDALTLFLRAGSLGDAHSLAVLPALASHRPLPPEVRRAAGIADGLVRLSVGLEDPADLVRDLDRALGAA